MTKKTTAPAKGSTKKPASKKGATKKQKVTNQKSALRSELQELSGVEARRDIIRVTVAGLLLIVTIFLFVALISNLFTSSADQAGVLSGELFSAHNKAGFLGAHASYFLMHQLFGFGTLLVPVFLLCIVFKLMMRAACPIRVWVLFVHTVIIMALISLDAAFVERDLMPEEWTKLFGFELGGMHGKEIITYLEGYVGSTITFILLACLTVAYIGYWFTQVFIWIFKFFHKVGGFIFRRKEEEEEILDGDSEESKENDEEEDADDDAETDGENDTDENSEEDSEPTTIQFAVNGEPVSEDVSSEDNSEESQENEDGATETAAEPVIGPDGQPLEDGVTVDPESGDLNLSINEVGEEEEAGTNVLAADDHLLKPYDPKLDLERYKYPTLDLLQKHDSGNTEIDMFEQNENKERIITVLRNFGVEITAIQATIGPTVTLYEITPAPGVRIAKIRNLEDDIALSLSALGIRIIAPIPGKGTIGIEVPNKKPQVVSMESIINTQKFRETRYELPVALGKTITNEMFMVDLAKMPHLLVAGATGQGKSVGLNALITSLLYKKHPAELKLVMVDPKKVEFSMYNPIINHFLAQVPDTDEPVITDVKKVITTLKSLCQEMDERYDLLKRARCKNIKEYNAKFCDRHLLPTEGHHYLPYIVVIIDEFGDLIMTAGKEIELPIARIAQLARAVGMHMVIATQSPRATIITGKIKANFPARMAFKVSGRIESQTILDRTGANNLIGRGDMLFQAGSDITRVQCAFVDTPEVEAITDFISRQQGYPAPFELPLVADDGSDGMEGISSVDGTSTFEQVAHFVVNTQMGSTSKIQRQFSVGFNRAGRLMDQLEEAGIVGPQLGSKPREVLVHSEMELASILQGLRDAGKHFE